MSRRPLFSVCYGIDSVVCYADAVNQRGDHYCPVPVLIFYPCDTMTCYAFMSVMH